MERNGSSRFARAGGVCALALIALAGSTAAFGAPPFPAVFELSSLNGTNGFVLNGEVSGHSVSSAGDVNGDGLGDVLIGAPYAEPGKTYVVFGGAGVGASGSIELSSLDGTNGFVVNGIEPGDRSGKSVHSAGDVNGDGVDDLIIGAPQVFVLSGAGEAYVVFGGPNVGASGSIELSSLDGATGFVVNGIDPGDDCGSSVSSAGDVNGDGIDDIVIGAQEADPDGRSNAGQAYVVFGKDTAVAGPFAPSIDPSSLNGANGFVVNGIRSNDLSGGSVSSAGDVNADGYADVLIGARNGNPNGRSFAGESYVVFGGPEVGSTGSINLSALDGTSGYVVQGIDRNDLSGDSVCSAGDVNGDGIDDIVIGAWAADPHGVEQAGESYVVFGGPDVGSSGLIALSALNGANGFTVNGIDTDDRSGFSVSSAGDVTGDGVDDIIIGAKYADPSGRTRAGESYVVFGKDTAVAGPFAPSIDASSLNGTKGFIVNGIGADDESGRAVSSAGDVNGDGIDDIVIGAQGADASYVVFGRLVPICAADLTGDGATDMNDFNILGAHFGQSVTPETDGDLNADGLVNILDFNIMAGNFGCGS